MNVLIVYAHPEPRSLNGALRDFSVAHLEAAGHTVQVTDLYAMNWKAAFDATAEGILVVDPEGNYVASNHVFHEMWRIPRSLLYRGQEEAVSKFALTLVHDPESLVERAVTIHRSRRDRSVDGPPKRRLRQSVHDSGSHALRAIGHKWGPLS